MTALLLFALFAQIVTPGEMNCIGFIVDELLPLNLYIAGTETEGETALAAEGDLVYLNGPAISTLRAGDTYSVVRPLGKVRDPYSLAPLGVHYKQLGRVRIEASGQDSAQGIVITSCEPLAKGDLLLPAQRPPIANFDAKPSDRLTPYVESGLTGVIVLGKDDTRELAVGQFCFVGIGAKNGVRVGDRFTVYRSQPPFNPQDLSAAKTSTHSSYDTSENREYATALAAMLADRKVQPRVIGDIVIVEAGERTAAAKVINSRSELHIGDLVVRR
jgi:hypothetical protein